MNRHQSNPFLAGWEIDDEVETRGAFDVNSTIHGEGNQNSDCPAGATRRHSSSQADVTGNPFGHQRSADRRLYHRNMSSFEAASIQLEQQQQLRENGAVELGNSGQTELIAKMTADFQSAIKTNDKQFGIEDGEPIELNAFDPFETIMDDDVSLPSPALTTDQAAVQSTKEPNNLNETSDLNQRQRKNTHDSIDDDDDELVSTPVRNIKSSPQRSEMQCSPDGQIENPPNDENNLTSDNSNVDPQRSMEVREKSPTQRDTDSIAKASLFASLLASAESSGQQVVVDNADKDDSPDLNARDTDLNVSALPTNKIEHATHVIKGSQSTGLGSVDRPVSFFDPFETVIDKDALTSLMNDNQQSAGPIADEDFAPPTRAPEPTPIHKAHRNPNDDSSSGNDRDLKPEVIAESTSTEDATENASSRLNNSIASKDSTVIKERQNTTQNDDRAIPRSSRSTGPETVISQPQVVPSRETLAKKSNKPKKKASFQEDSSDSSDDEDRIQIVIKARDFNQTDTQVGPTIVPLLPPPPSKSSMKQARERGKVEDMPSPVMSYKTRADCRGSDNAQSETMNAESSEDHDETSKRRVGEKTDSSIDKAARVSTRDGDYNDEDAGEDDDQAGQFVIPMTHSDDEGETYGKPDTPLYDEDTSYVLDEFPAKYEGSGWEMMLRYPPKKKLTSNRFWKKIFVKLTQYAVPPEKSSKQPKDTNEAPQTCIALQIYDKPDDKKPMQEIPIQATYTVSEISSQQFDQFGKIFTIKLQYIFYKERVGVRQGQLARFIHTGHIGASTTSGGHGVDPISIGAIKRIGAPIEHSPQISQIIKLGCTSYNEIKIFKNCLEDYLFKMPIHRDRALSTYKTEEVQMAVRDETYLELNQVGTIIKQLARVRIFFLSFLNGTPTVEVGINDIHRQGREVVGRMDILPVVTEEWIRLEAWELHSTVEKEEFENPDSRIIKLVPPDATFFELMRFRIRPPRNRELPLQVSANMSVTRTKVSMNCEVMVPGCVSRKHGQIPCENIAIKMFIPECWIYFFREEKHFRMGSKKSVNRRPGKVKGIERFLGGGGLQEINDESSLIEVTSGQAKYEHHHNAIVWRAARWPKESQSAYVQNTMKIRLPLTAYDKMPESFNEHIHVEYTMPATTVSHTTLRSISVNPCDDEPPEKYVKYSAKYEYTVKMRLSVNLGTKPGEAQPEASPIVIMKQPDLHGDLQREEDSDARSDVDDASDQD